MLTKSACRLTLWGVFRYPNRNTNHFVSFDLKSTINQIIGPTTTILAGDINIDIIIFEYDDYKIPVEIASLYNSFHKKFRFSGYMHDHVFVRSVDKNNMNSNYIISGIFVNDTIDNWPCFLPVKCGIQTYKNTEPQKVCVMITIAENLLIQWKEKAGKHICIR